MVVESLNNEYLESQINSKSLAGRVIVEEGDPNDPLDLTTKIPRIQATSVKLREFLKSDSSGKLFEVIMEFEKAD